MFYNAIAVGLGGFLGSICRYLVGLGIQTFSHSQFPWATLLVNVSGCFAIGVVYSLFGRNSPNTSSLFLFMTTGFLGGFTTFSAFGLETQHLLSSQRSPSAMLSIFLNVCLGILAVHIGRRVM